MLAVTYVTNILSYVHAVADIDTCNTLFAFLSLPRNVFVEKVIDWKRKLILLKYKYFAHSECLQNT